MQGNVAALPLIDLEFKKTRIPKNRFFTVNGFNSYSTSLSFLVKKSFKGKSWLVKLRKG